MNDQILALDPINPQVAARMARTFERWKRFEPKRQTLMKTSLEQTRGDQWIVEGDHRGRDQGPGVNPADPFQRPFGCDMNSSITSGGGWI